MLLLLANGILVACHGELRRTTRGKASTPRISVQKVIRQPNAPWFDGAHHDIPRAKA